MSNKRFECLRSWVLNTRIESNTETILSWSLVCSYLLLLDDRSLSKYLEIDLQSHVKAASVTCRKCTDWNRSIRWSIYVLGNRYLYTIAGLVENFLEQSLQIQMGVVVVVFFCSFFIISTIFMGISAFSLPFSLALFRPCFTSLFHSDRCLKHMQPYAQISRALLQQQSSCPLAYGNKISVYNTLLLSLRWLCGVSNVKNVYQSPRKNTLSQPFN